MGGVEELTLSTSLSRLGRLGSWENELLQQLLCSKPKD